MGRHTNSRSYSGRHSNKPTAKRTSHRSDNAAQATRTATVRVQTNRSAAIHAAIALATSGQSAAVPAFAIAGPSTATAPRRASAHRSSPAAARSSAARSLAARTANGGGSNGGKRRTRSSSRKPHVLGLGRMLRVSKARLLVAISTLLTISSLAVAGSWAAWTAADSNGSNTFTTDTVLLADNQGGEAGNATNVGTAMFNVTNMNPGSTATTQCIGVKIVSGTATGVTVGMTITGGDTGGTTHLDHQLTMNAALYAAGGTSTTPGSNTNSGSCTSYPGGGTTMGATGTTIGANSLDTWSTSGPYTGSTTAEVWYKFTVSGLPAADTSCATYCSKSLTIQFTWTLTAT